MAQPLVDQHRSTRVEFGRALAGTPPGDGERRFEPLNSTGWIDLPRLRPEFVGDLDRRAPYQPEPAR